MKTFLIALICCLQSLVLSAQVNSIASGDWNDPATWDTGVPTIGDVVFINNTHEVFINTAITVVALSVESGGILRMDPGGSINGTVTVTDGGTYSHNRNGGTVPTATWEDGSTCEIVGWVSTTGTSLNTFLASLNQSFYHFKWNNPGQTQLALTLQGNLSIVRGDLTIENTGASSSTKRRLVFGLSNGSTQAMSVGGDFNVIGNSAILINTTGTFTMNVGGNVNLNSSYVYTGDIDNWIYGINSSFGTSNLVVAGDLNLLAGKLNLVVKGTFDNSQIGGITIGGNFNFSAGELGTWTDGGIGNITFNGSKKHQYVLTSGSFESAPINYSVPLGDTLDLGTYVLGNTTTPSGTYTSNGATITRSLNVGGALSGNLFTSTKTFNSGSAIIYGGAATQYVGSEHPSTTGVTAVIDNASGVSMIAPVTIGGNLNLASGNILVGSQTLTLNGNLINNGHFIEVATTSSLIINGTGTFGTIPFSGSSSMANFTLDRTSSGTAALGNSIAISTNYIQNAGTLQLNGNTLTIDNNFTGSAKAINGTATSALIINGTGLMTGSVALTGTIGTVTLNQTQTVSATSNATITNLNLYNGIFDNASTLSMASGGLITRTAGSINNEPACTGTYNVLYQNSGSINSGAELPASLTKLANLTKEGTGTVTLTSNIRVNGNLLLTDGTLDAASTTITQVGNFTSNATASMSNSTITFAGSTTISGSTIPELGNVNVLAGSTLNLPTALSIAGDVNLNTTSVFNVGDGTITLSGAADQDVNGGGKTFHILDVDKPSGEVFLTGNVFMDSLLTVSSSNTIFNANGFLTLRSTSDKNYGNASIGPLLNNAEVRGNVITQRFVSSEGRIYRYISSPVVNAPVSQLQDDVPVTGPFSGASSCSGCTVSSPSLYFYDASAAAYQRYPDVINSETFEPGRGYVPFFRHNVTGAVTIDFTGEVNQGTMNLPLEHNPTNPIGSWNLVGNPYPSTVYWDDQATGLWTKTNISNSIVIRDNGRDNGTLGAPRFLYWNGTVGDENFEGEIAAGQAFWVETIAAAPQLTITENAKASATGEFYRKATPDVLVATINRTGYNGYDRTYVQLHDNAEVGFDFLDGSKFENDHFDLFTQIGDTKPLAINALNEIACGTTMNLGLRFKAKASGGYELNPVGGYKLSFDFKGYKFDQHEITLVDTYTNSSTIVSQGVSYSFVITSDPASFNVNRFQLQFDGRNPRIDLPVLISHAQVCSEDEAFVTVQESETGLNYSLQLNGQQYASVIGNGNEIQFAVLTDDLEQGINEIKVGVSGNCGDQVLTTVQHIQNNKADVAILVQENNQLESNFPSRPNAWYFNDALMEDVSGNRITANESGVYKVVVNIDGCASSSDEVSLIVNGKEEDQNLLVKVYPNPASKDLYVKSRVDNIKNITVLNAMGQLQSVAIKSTGNGEWLIAVENLANGLYFLRVNTTEGIQEIRFVKSDQ